MPSRRITRRAFVSDLGKGGLAVAVFGLTALACSGDEAEPTTTTAGNAGPATTTTTPPAATTAAPVTPPDSTGVVWERVNLGFVSAYVLARRGEAVIVDTGVAGSEGDIEASLNILDLSWTDVGHVIVTHLHNDHQGSLPAVMDLALDAVAYAGTADIPEIRSPRELVPVGDGDKVFDLDIIETPGHTPGHISVLDADGGLLVAGDALNGSAGGVIGANPDFTPDMATADLSVVKLAGYTYETVVFGHGEPVTSAASEAVAALAASL